MAISGTSLVIRKYWDETQNKMIDVETSVRDAILFDYLRQLIGAMRGKNG